MAHAREQAEREVAINKKEAKMEEMVKQIEMQRGALEQQWTLMQLRQK